jgi:hypothetical protein
MSGHVLLAVLGTVAGLLYVTLGVLALRHVLRPSEVSEVDRVVGWSLWWWIDWGKYTRRGRQLCVAGGIAFITGAVCWVLWFSRLK